MAIKLGGGGGSASQINEVVNLGTNADTVTLADGRVYLKGGLLETNLSTYPNAFSAWKPLSSGWSVGDSAPQTLDFFDNHFWICGNTGNSVVKYTSSGSYVSSFPVNVASENAPAGITNDGTDLWVYGAYNSRVYRYTTAGAYQNSFLVTTQIPSQAGKGIVYDGTSFWIINTSTAVVHKYNSSFVYQNVSFSVGTQTAYPKDITWDGTYFWVAAGIGAAYGGMKVYKYNSSGVYQNEFFDTPSVNNGALAGVVWDGTDFYIMGNQQRRVAQYSQAVGVPSVTTSGGQNYVRVA